MANLQPPREPYTGAIPWWFELCRSCGKRIDILHDLDLAVQLGPGAWLCGDCSRDAETIAAGRQSIHPPAFVHSLSTGDTSIIGSDDPSASSEGPDSDDPSPSGGPPTVHQHNAGDRQSIALGAALAAMAYLMAAADALDAADLDDSLTHPARRAAFELVTSLGGTLADVYAVTRSRAEPDYSRHGEHEGPSHPDECPRCVVGLDSPAGAGEEVEAFRG